jgi:hypothetical protein
MDYGYCPNCASGIPMDSELCPTCSADFRGGGAWKPGKEAPRTVNSQPLFLAAEAASRGMPRSTIKSKIGIGVLLICLSLVLFIALSDSMFTATLTGGAGVLLGGNANTVANYLASPFLGILIVFLMFASGVGLVCWGIVARLFAREQESTR